MNEAELKGAFVTLAQQSLTNSVVFRHEDIFSAGIPDTTVTWNRRTTWLESKYMNPRFIGKRLQCLKMMDLAFAGNAWYVLYQERRGERVTRIVEPRDIFYKRYDAGIFTTGHDFDQDFIVEFIRWVHENDNHKPEHFHRSAPHA